MYIAETSLTFNVNLSCHRFVLSLRRIPHSATCYSGVKSLGCTAVRWCLCWTEFCDLVEIWLFTVKCFVFKWPWPWWDNCKVVWKCMVAGGETESVHVALFSKSVQVPVCLIDQQHTHCVNPKKRRQLLICMFHLSALSSRFTSFGFSKSMFTDIYVTACDCLGLHCPPVLLNADTNPQWWQPTLKWFT